MSGTTLDWAALYQAHTPRLRRVVGRYVPSQLVDDVVQDAFLRAYRNRASFQGDRPIGPWLTTIARRAAIDALRSTGSASPTDVTLDWPGDADSVEDELLNSIRRVSIERTLRDLTPRYQQLLRAELWGFERPATVERSALARARRAFRKRYASLAEETGVFGGGTLGLLGRWCLVIRQRAQRYLITVGEQVVVGVLAAFGAALLATAVASTGNVGSNSLDSGGGVEVVARHGADIVLAAAADPTMGRPSAEKPREGFVEPAPTNESRTIGTRIRSDTTIGDQGRTAGVDSRIWITTPESEQRHETVVRAHCDGGIAPRAMCLVLQMFPTTVVTSDYGGAESTSTE